MELRRVKIDGYKNVRACDIDFADSPFINAIIGGNGSGKSNLFKAILQILIGCYFQKPPHFEFTLEFQARGRLIIFQRVCASLSPWLSEKSIVAKA